MTRSTHALLFVALVSAWLACECFIEDYHRAAFVCSGVTFVLAAVAGARAGNRRT